MFPEWVGWLQGGLKILAYGSNDALWCSYTILKLVVMPSCLVECAAVVGGIIRMLIGPSWSSNMWKADVDRHCTESNCVKHQDVPIAVWFSNWEECLGKTRIPVPACFLIALLSPKVFFGYLELKWVCAWFTHLWWALAWTCNIGTAASVITVRRLYLFSQALLVTQQEGSNLWKMTVPEWSMVPRNKACCKGFGSLPTCEIWCFRRQSCWKLNVVHP